MDRHQYIAEGRDTVPGWFQRTDAVLFDTIDSAQRRAGIGGDILEIGCYQGASAVLLGYLRQPGERFIVCDLFDGDVTDPEDEAERQRFDTNLSRRTFEANYLMFHRDLPEIIAGPSSGLFDLELARTFRLIHVDGSHAYDLVRSDLLLSKQLLMPGGVVAFDDIISVHTPGVTAAVWEGVLRDELVPLFQSRKFYGTWGAPFHVDVPEELPSCPHEVLGHAMLHVEDPVAVVDPPAVVAGDGRHGEVSGRQRRLLLWKRRVVAGLRRRAGPLRDR
jgi:hypothetical protein